VILGQGTSIAAEVFLHGPAILGHNVSLNVQVRIDGGSAGIEIGDDTRIASGVAIYAFDHRMEPERTIREQPIRSRGIRIGRDVWIGANACITDGVHIGDGAVVGAGSVVTKDVAPGVVVAGIPAQWIRDR
jgi:acetyltransferase-like isoleucine patch superfamily enzyme